MEYKQVDQRKVDDPEANQINVFGMIMKADGLGNTFKNARVVVNELLKHYNKHYGIYFLNHFWKVGECLRDVLSKKV